MSGRVEAHTQKGILKQPEALSPAAIVHTYSHNGPLQQVLTPMAGPISSCSTATDSPHLPDDFYSGRLGG